MNDWFHEKLSFFFAEILISDFAEKQVFIVTLISREKREFTIFFSEMESWNDWFHEYMKPFCAIAMKMRFLALHWFHEKNCKSMRNCILPWNVETCFCFS